MNKLACCLLALLLGGCVSKSGPLLPEDQVLGQFSSTEIHASLVLVLKADHTYTEDAVDANGVMPDENGVIHAEGRLLSSGSWKLEPGGLVLTPAEGKRRKLEIQEIDGAIRLHEALGRTSREYSR